MWRSLSPWRVHNHFMRSSKMLRSAILNVACIGVIWISRSTGVTLLEVNDERASIGRPAVPREAQAAQSARSQVPVQTAGRTRPLKADDVTVVATNEPLEYPGLYASLLRA